MALNWRLILAVVLVNFSGLFQFGYFTSIYNQPSLIVQRFINSTQKYGLNEVEGHRIWSMTMSMLNVGMIMGTLIGFPICQRLGRRPCLLYSAALGSIGAVLQSISRPTGIYQLIAIGRLVSGVSVGISCVVVPLFGTEVSPKRYRGAVGCLCSTSFAIGNLVANLIAVPTGLGNEHQWHYMPLLILIFTLAVLGIVSRIPETPVYLMQKEAGLARIGHSLTFYHGRLTPFEYSKTLGELEEECSEGEAVPLRKMLKERHYQKAILITVAMASANAFHGTAAIYTYMSYIVRWTGITDVDTIAMVSLLFSATDVLFSLPSFFLIEKIGRRPLILAGNWILTICLFIISVSLITRQETNSSSVIYFYVFLAALLTDIGSISIGVGKANWFLNTEMFPAQTRPIFTMVNSGTQNILNMIMSVSFLSLQDAVGAYSFLILFALPMLALTILITFFVQETKQLTVNQILEGLKGSAWRKDKRNSDIGQISSDYDDKAENIFKPTYRTVNS